MPESNQIQIQISREDAAFVVAVLAHRWIKNDNARHATANSEDIDFLNRECNQIVRIQGAIDIALCQGYSILTPEEIQDRLTEIGVWTR